MIADDVLAALLAAHAPLTPCALVPDISAWRAVDELPLWQALESAAGAPVDPPFFAVAWPGAQALARAIKDGLVDVAGAVVADVGCGSGVAALAALLHGAARVVAVDVDALAVQSAALLAADQAGSERALLFSGRSGDALADPGLVRDADVILAGDLVSSARHAPGFRAAVAQWRAAGKRVVLADSGRPFFHDCGLRCVAVHDVAVPYALEGTARRTVRVYV